MKGFINEYRIDVPPCGTCKHKNKMVDEAPCDKCIDKTDLALRKPANETEFSNYERSDEIDEKSKYEAYCFDTI